MDNIIINETRTYSDMLGTHIMGILIRKNVNYFYNIDIAKEKITTGLDGGKITKIFVFDTLHNKNIIEYFHNWVNKPQDAVSEEIFHSLKEKYLK